MPRENPRGNSCFAGEVYVGVDDDDPDDTDPVDVFDEPVCVRDIEML